MTGINAKGKPWLVFWELLVAVSSVSCAMHQPDFSCQERQT